MTATSGIFGSLGKCIAAGRNRFDTICSSSMVYTVTLNNFTSTSSTVFIPSFTSNGASTEVGKDVPIGIFGTNPDMAKLTQLTLDISFPTCLTLRNITSTNNGNNCVVSFTFNVPTVIVINTVTQGNDKNINSIAQEAQITLYEIWVIAFNP